MVLVSICVYIHTSRLTIVSHEAKKQALRNKQVSYLQVHTVQTGYKFNAKRVVHAFETRFKRVSHALNASSLHVISCVRVWD